MRLLYSVVIVFLLGCCQRNIQSLSRSELIQYANNPDNGLVVSIMAEDLKLTAHYKPKDLILDQHLVSPDIQSLNKLRAELQEYDYFIVQFSKEGREIESYFSADTQQSNSLLRYLSGGIDNDFLLVNGRDTVQVDQTIYTPHYGSATSTSLMLIFKSDILTKNKDITLIYNDSFFKSGQSFFRFDIDEIKHIPKLNLFDSLDTINQ